MFILCYLLNDVFMLMISYNLYVEKINDTRPLAVPFARQAYDEKESGISDLNDRIERRSTSPKISFWGRCYRM
jgi:hypothetical protein